MRLELIILPEHHVATAHSISINVFIGAVIDYPHRSPAARKTPFFHDYIVNLINHDIHNVLSESFPSEDHSADVFYGDVLNFRQFWLEKTFKQYQPSHVA